MTPIYLQYIQKKKVNQISLKRRIPLNSWTGIAPKYIAEKGIHKRPNTKALNALLNKKIEVSSNTARQIEVFRRKLKEYAPNLYLNQID